MAATDETPTVDFSSRAEEARVRKLEAEADEAEARARLMQLRVGIESDLASENGGGVDG